MTVKQLKALLDGQPDDALVVIPDPRTGHDDEEYNWKIAEVLEGPDSFCTDPNEPNRGKVVGGGGYERCVTIW